MCDLARLVFSVLRVQFTACLSPGKGYPGDSFSIPGIFCPGELRREGFHSPSVMDGAGLEWEEMALRDSA